MTILSLDPGTRCGWAIFRGGVPVQSGTLNLAPTRHEGPGMRWVKLRSALTQFHAAHQLDMIVYEEVRRHAGTSAAHIYGGLVATLQMFATDTGVNHTAIPVGTVKRHATGKGNADKDAMMQAARKRWPAIELTDDNHADALWIGSAAWELYGRAAQGGVA